MAAAAIPLAINLGSAVTKLGLNDLLQHTLRLKDAKNENATIGPVVAAFDLDFKTIVSAYNQAEAPASLCIQALGELDSKIYNYMKSGTISSSGGTIPGTFWNDSVGLSGKCNKQCTAGCCVYFGDIGPPISLARVAMGGQPTRPSTWNAGDTRYKAIKGGAVVTVPEVFPSKYGGVSRPLYTVTIVAPPPAAEVQANLKSTINSMLGTQPADPLQAVLKSAAVNPPLVATKGTTVDKTTAASAAGADGVPLTDLSTGPLGTLGGADTLATEFFDNPTILLISGIAIFGILIFAMLFRRA